tara:strand:- start:834 stop:1166 length:333 start_codon:yes stop_codon:yes gene_type:complete
MAKLETITIASGASTSSEVSFIRSNDSFEMGSVILSGTYTNTSFDVQAKVDGTFYDVYDTFGSKFSITVAAGKHSLPADVFKDVDVVRLKGSQNEASDRTAHVLLIDFVD